MTNALFRPYQALFLLLVVGIVSFVLYVNHPEEIVSYLKTGRIYKLEITLTTYNTMGRKSVWKCLGETPQEWACREVPRRL